MLSYEFKAAGLREPQTDCFDLILKNLTAQYQCADNTSGNSNYLSVGL